MNEKPNNETHDDIIAEMRIFKCRNLETGELELCNAIANYFADRLEAAAKRMEWTHKKELETRDAVIQTEVAAREAEREAHKREIDEAERRASHATMKNVSETLAKVGPLYDAESIGNAAKLREALEHMVRAETYGSMERDDLCGRCLEKMFARCNHDGTCWVDKAITALAAPPRNCDRFDNADDAKKEFNYLWNFVWKRGGGYVNESEYWSEYEKWLFAPATEQEGGNDGN